MYIKLTRFEDNDGRKIPLKYYWGAVVFEKKSKTSRENSFRLSEAEFFCSIYNFFCDIVLVISHKTTAPQQLIF